MSDELIMALMELERDEIVEAVKSRVEKGEDSLQILDELSTSSPNCYCLLRSLREQ